jgi:hypothetical protein
MGEEIYKEFDGIAAELAASVDGSNFIFTIRGDADESMSNFGGDISSMASALVVLAENERGFEAALLDSALNVLLNDSTKLTRFNNAIVKYLNEKESEVRRDNK